MTQAILWRQSSLPRIHLIIGSVHFLTVVMNYLAVRQVRSLTWTSLGYNRVLPFWILWSRIHFLAFSILLMPLAFLGFWSSFTFKASGIAFSLYLQLRKDLCVSRFVQSIWLTWMMQHNVHISSSIILVTSTKSPLLCKGV